jgi:hypothetical protein
LLRRRRWRNAHERLRGLTLPTNVFRWLHTGVTSPRSVRCGGEAIAAGTMGPGFGTVGPGEFEIAFPTTNGSSPLLQRRIAEGAAELLLAELYE